MAWLVVAAVVLAVLAGLCAEHGALLVMDEVLTGFRVTRSGWYGREGVAADLMTFGKVMGGGLPAAAFGGRADIMARMAPSGPVYQAGTLSGNPLATAAGLATLRGCTDEVYSRVDEVAAAARFRHMVTPGGFSMSVATTSCGSCRTSIAS